MLPLQNVYKNKSDCCGCSVCSFMCKLGAIKMIADFEGFLYPEIDQKKCIGCCRCQKVCPTYDISKYRD